MSDDIRRAAVASFIGSMQSTDGVIAAARDAFPGMDSEVLEASIPLCIDALYAARDAGLSMHQAGGVVAIVALAKAHELRRLT